MHRLGVCHRDLHLANIIVDADARALIVDPDFAVDSDQGAPCYDLYGPEASGVPVPAEHAGYWANRGGDWRDWAAEGRCSPVRLGCSRAWSCRLQRAALLTIRHRGTASAPKPGDLFGGQYTDGHRWQQKDQ